MEFQFDINQQEQLYFINDNRYLWKEQEVFTSNMKSLFHQMKKEIKKHMKQLEFYHQRRKSTCSILNNMKTECNNNEMKKEIEHEMINGIVGFDEMKRCCHLLKKNVEMIENKFESSEDSICNVLKYLDDVENSLFDENDETCLSNEKNNHKYNEMNCYLHKETMNQINELYQCNLLVSLIGNNGNEIHSDSNESSDNESHDNTSSQTSQEFDSENDVLLVLHTGDWSEENGQNDVLKNQTVSGTPSNTVYSSSN